MKTIKIWISNDEKSPEGIITTKRNLVDFTFSEAIVLGYYITPFKIYGEGQDRIVITTAIGTFHAPYSLTTEKIVEECVEKNSWKFGINKEPKMLKEKNT